MHCYIPFFLAKLLGASDENAMVHVGGSGGSANRGLQVHDGGVTVESPTPLGSDITSRYRAIAPMPTGQQRKQMWNYQQRVFETFRKQQEFNADMRVENERLRARAEFQSRPVNNSSLLMSWNMMSGM